MIGIQRSEVNIETISSIMFFLTPFSILIYYIIGKFTRPGNELTKVFNGMYWKFASTETALLT